MQLPKHLRSRESLPTHVTYAKKLAREPGSFRVSLPSEDIAFNRTVYMDIMYLDGKSVLNIVYKRVLKDTQFSAAAFLSQGETTEDVWHIYMTHWVIPYVLVIPHKSMLTRVRSSYLRNGSP